MPEMKSILFPTSGALLALIILFASIYVYQVNVSTVDSEELSNNIESEIIPNQGTAYKQSVPEREGYIYDTPIILIYLIIHSDKDIVSIEINKILISINGIELDITSKSLFLERTLKTNQKILLSAVPLYPGQLDYVKVEIAYSIDKLPVKREIMAEYAVPMEIEYGRIHEITVSIDI